MNYLAHLYFGGETSSSLLGNLMGDFVKGTKLNFTDMEIINGIYLHRSIDNYTDNHLIVKQSKSRISKYRRRYAGIMIDVFYDHFLAIHWNLYSDIDFHLQIDEWYKKLKFETSFELPERLNRVIPLMAAEDWLSTYQTTAGICNTIDRISKRIRFKNSLAGGGNELIKNYSSLEQDFHRFFPQLKRFVSNHPPKFQE